MLSPVCIFLSPWGFRLIFKDWKGCVYHLGALYWRRNTLTLNLLFLVFFCFLVICCHLVLYHFRVFVFTYDVFLLDSSFSV